MSEHQHAEVSQDSISASLKASEPCHSRAPGTASEPRTCIATWLLSESFRKRAPGTDSETQSPRAPKKPIESIWLRVPCALNESITERAPPHERTLAQREHQRTEVSQPIQEYQCA